MNIATYGLDIAKTVMQVYWVDDETGALGQQTLRRAQLAPFFANRPAGRILIEACGNAHHWVRTLGLLGHKVQLEHLLHACACGNKNDSTDARLIWNATSQSGFWTALKGVQKQAILAQHWTHSRWVKTLRAKMVNGLRERLNEFGMMLSERRLKTITSSCMQLYAALPKPMRGIIDEYFMILWTIGLRIVSR